MPAPDPRAAVSAKERSGWHGACGVSRLRPDAEPARVGRGRGTSVRGRQARAEEDVVIIKSQYPNIEYIEGDLLAAYRDGVTVLGHQCNCRGAWRGGIHKQIGERFPEVIRQYVSHPWRLGDMRLFATHIPGFRIAYLAGQDRYGNSQRSGTVYTDIQALTTAMVRLADAMQDDDEVAFPLIGAGLAGGNWSVIVRMIADTFARRHPGKVVRIYVLPGTPVEE